MNLFLPLPLARIVRQGAGIGARAFGCPFDHPKVTTVSGLVLLLLGGPAAVGDVVDWQNLRIEVVATAGRGVADALVTRMPVRRP